MIDPKERPFDEIIVDIAPTGSARATDESKSVILLDAFRKLQHLHLNQHNIVGFLEAIVKHNSLLHQHRPVGTASKETEQEGCWDNIGMCCFGSRCATCCSTHGSQSIPSTE